jgi:outer membrane immunogenic protein
MTNKIDSLGSIRGRLGYAMDRWLVYATGGWAWSNGHTDYAFTGAAPFFSNGEGRSGWTLGAGVEYAITNNVIGRLEYRYTDLGSKGYIDPVTNSAEQGNKVTLNAVRAGIAYKF